MLVLVRAAAVVVAAVVCMYFGAAVLRETASGLNRTTFGLNFWGPWAARNSFRAKWDHFRAKFWGLLGCEKQPPG